MLVLAAVSKMLKPRLRAGAPASFELVYASSWEHAVETVLQRPVEIAVLDPQLDQRDSAHEVERIRALFPSLPVILYTSLSPAAAVMLLRLGGLKIRHVIIAWHDDHPSHMQASLRAESSSSISRTLLAAVEDVLNLLPNPLRRAVEASILEPGEIQSVNALAARAGIDRRTCLRRFQRAGLAPPRAVLAALRLLHAHRLLQDPGYTVEDVARRLGFSQTRSFSQQVREIFGMTPGELRVSLPPEEALQIVREQMFAAYALRTAGGL